MYLGKLQYCVHVNNVKNLIINVNSNTLFFNNYMHFEFINVIVNVNVISA